MATTSLTEILRTHVDIIKPMLMTDEFCRVYATTSRTTRAAASKLENRWAALSFESLQQHMVDGLIEEHEDDELEGWLKLAPERRNALPQLDQKQQQLRLRPAPRSQGATRSRQQQLKRQLR